MEEEEEDESEKELVSQLDSDSKLIPLELELLELELLELLELGPSFG